MKRRSSRSPRAAVWLEAARLVACALACGACGEEATSAPATSAEHVEAHEDLRHVTATFSGTTCEAARDAWSASRGASAAPTMAVFGAILEEGSYLETCRVSPNTPVSVCVAVVDGAVRGMTIDIERGTQRQAECVVRAVAHLSYPVANHMSLAKTRFAGE